MRVVKLSDLYKYDFYIKNLDVLHAIPKIEVENYQYKNIPVGHLVYGSRGTAEYFNKNTKITISPQTLAYIPTGVTINFKEDEDYEYYKIYFNLYDSKTNEEIIFSENPIIFLEKTTTEIAHQIYELTTIYAVNHEVGKIKILSLLYSLFYSIITSLDKNINRTHSSIISNALIFMQANYQHDFTTKQLAEMCNISEQYFRKVFKKQMKMTPTEYKNTLRINRACNELNRSATIPIWLLADATGFHNIQYFCETFKKITGYSPLQYRNNIKRKNEK